MKELWSILMDKLKQIEPTIAAVIIGVCGLFTIGMTTIVTCKFFHMVIRIVEVLGAEPTKHKGF